MDDLICSREMPEGLCVLRLAGEVDLSTVHVIRDAAADSIRAHGPTLRLDLSSVMFMDCAGVAALLAISRCVRARGGTLDIEASRPVSKVIRLARVERVLHVTTEVA